MFYHDDLLFILGCRSNLHRRHGQLFSGRIPNTDALPVLALSETVSETITTKVGRDCANNNVIATVGCPPATSY